MTLHIVLDLQPCQSPESSRRGIGRYSLSLAKAMAAQPRGHRISILLNSEMPGPIESLRAQFGELIPQDDIVVWRGIAPTAHVDGRNTFRRRAAELLRLDALRSIAPDVVHVASLFEGMADNVVGTVSREESYLTAVTLYDLIPLAHQGTYLSDRRVRQWYMEKVEHLRQAHHLLGISRFSCEEARDMLSIPEGRLTDISGAADDIFVVLADRESFRAELMLRYGVRKPFIMYAGGFDTRKNIGALIRAFARLPARLRDGHQVLVVGDAPAPERAVLEQVAASAGLSSGDVVFAGYVPDADLVKLYNLCALYAFPSLQEGFGLPALEAMSSGAIVIGSATSSLPEVIGFEDALFDPRDEAALSAKMELALSDDGFRGRFLEHAAMQVRRFSWPESARRALEGLESAVERESAQRVWPAAPAMRDDRVALLPAPGSSLHTRMPSAETFADKDAGSFPGSRPLSELAARRNDFDRVVVEVADASYCAKTLALVAGGPADIVVGNPRLGKCLAEVGRRDRKRLIEIVYRGGGFPALRQVLDAGLDQEVLAGAVPSDTFGALDAWQVVPDPVVPSHGPRTPWRDRADAIIAALRTDPASADATAQDWILSAAAMAANGALAESSKRWLVDITNLAIRDAGTGIQRVVRHMLDELVASPPPGCRIEPVSLGDDGVFRHARAYCQRRYFPEEILPGDEVVDFRPGDVYLGLDLVAHLVPAHLERFRALRNQGVELYFVLYDLLPLQRPDCFEPHLLPLFRSWYEAIAEVADGILCISRAVADEFESWLQQSRPERRRPLGIGWFHLGADLSKEVALQPARDARALPEARGAPTILMVGTIEPRKGHAQVLAAFERLWARGVDVNLMIIGRAGWLVGEVAERLRTHPDNGTRLSWLEDADDDVLLAAYRDASALLMASEGEGFGLPLIEAARHGVPLIARDLPVFREIAGEHAFYFDGYGAGDLADSLESWLSLRSRGAEPASAGLSWKSWSEAATRLAEVVTSGEWSHRWMPGRTRRFAAFDYRLQTQVGRLRHGWLESTGRAGMLAYGPYVPLEAGSYSLEVVGSGTGRGCIDVCSSKGGEVHALGAFDILAPGGMSVPVLAGLDFDLMRDVTDLEIRVAVEDGADLRIQAFELRRNAIRRDAARADEATNSRTIDRIMRVSKTPERGDSLFAKKEF